MFTHLHVHTEYSMLDGLSRIEPLVRQTQELGMDSLAITDHGGLYGAIDFYRYARDAGVKPIIGCEMYVAPGSRHDRSPADKSPYHLTVLAKDAVGYHNLVKLVTKSHLEGFYYKPRVDRELLQQYSQGLIVLSGCPSGEVPRLITQERMDEARATASWYRELFGDYFLELMEHGAVPELPVINKGLIELHRQLDVPVVATNDSHYVFKQDAPLQDILICIHTNTNIHDKSRLRMSEDSYYLKSPQEMAALYPESPDAIANTQRIAEMCDLQLDFSQLRLPEFRVPDGMDADAYLEKLCWEGLRRRIKPVTSQEEERLGYELAVIKQTRFTNYFLVVWDIARFVKERDIYFAVRGSAAASLALYCLAVTDINPLSYRLVFERFLNLERKKMPDIDMDFQDDRREEVLNYVVSKYGRDHVAQIITFGTLGARASVRDVGRALAMPYADVDRVARLVPFRLHITLDEALEQSPELREIYEADEGVKNLVDTARSLEGLTRHSSTHAAGVVIYKEPLDEVVPLQKPIRGDEEGATMTQYAMEPIAALGLLQLDFLGLVNLTILAKARDLIGKTLGVQVNLRDIPLDDSKAFELLSRGETVGLFQVEGAGMTRYIKELKPSSLGDVAAMIALYRPGPMEHISTFIDAKHGRAEPHYPHPALKDILEETYGVIVYQDQVLHIARTFAGYSLGEADIVRIAMGKKIPEIMAQERQGFIQGALKQGYSQDLAEEIFALIEPFAGYAFNKAHSVSYGLISYWTAYLKANYPAEYMTSLLNSYIDNTAKTTTAVVECRRLGIPVLPPDVNRSQGEFSIEESGDGQRAIRFGLAAIKNVSAAALQPMLEARDKEGSFSSIEHMCRVADMNGLKKQPLESLVRAGAFDGFGDRGALLTVVDRIITLAQSEAGLRDSDQATMFDMFGDTVPTPLATISLPDTETPVKEMQQWERALMGIALSGANLLTSLPDSSETIVFRSQIEPDMDKKKVALLGQVSAVTERYTRNNKPFTIATLSLMDGPVDVFVWEELQRGTRDLWQEGKLVMVVGTVRMQADEISIRATDASEYTAPDDLTDEDAAVSIPAEADHTAGSRDESGESGAPQPEPAWASVPEAASVTDGVSATDGASNLPSTQAGQGTSRRLHLSISETDQPATDQMLLDDAKRLLLEYGGEDEVTLEIVTDGRVVTLEWPLVRVNACPELEDRLVALLGKGGHASVEGVAS